MARYGPSDMHKKLADILSRMESGSRDKLMADLDTRDHAAAQRVRDLMFTFDDLNRIDTRGLQKLLRHIDHETLALALKGANAAQAKPFFDNMSARAATLLHDDIKALGPVRAADVEAARAQIAATAQNLADNGTIFITDAGDDYIS